MKPGTLSPSSATYSITHQKCKDSSVQYQPFSHTPVDLSGRIPVSKQSTAQKDEAAVILIAKEKGETRNPLQDRVSFTQ